MKQERFMDLFQKFKELWAGYWFAGGFKVGARELSVALIGSTDFTCDSAFSVCVRFPH